MSTTVPSRAIASPLHGLSVGDMNADDLALPLYWQQSHQRRAGGTRGDRRQAHTGLARKLRPRGTNGRRHAVGSPRREGGEGGGGWGGRWVDDGRDCLASGPGDMAGATGAATPAALI